MGYNESFNLGHKELAERAYLEAARIVRANAYNSLEDSILKDLVLPLPFTSSEDLTEGMLFQLLQHLLFPV